MEILLSLWSTVNQEGEQRGDQLGAGSNIWLLQKPQHPLRTAHCHCSRHWEGQSVTVGASLPPSILDQPVPLTDAPGPTMLPHPYHVPPLFLNLSTLRTLRELLKKKKRRNHYIFLRPAISTVCWAHDWWADLFFVKRLHFWFLMGVRSEMSYSPIKYVEGSLEAIQPVMVFWCLLWSGAVLQKPILTVL